MPAAATPSVVVPPAVAVDIADFAFGPAEIAVAPGTTIVWTNRDDIPHDVVAADAPRAFRSAPLDTDERFAFRFDREGRFPYYCSLHSRMQGVVVVR
nr:plastocyanin/azurin family copper-binding protein [Roseomonas acroporae]